MSRFLSMLASTEGNSVSAFTIGSQVACQLLAHVCSLKMVCCWSQRSASNLIWIGCGCENLRTMRPVNEIGVRAAAVVPEVCCAA